MPIASLADGEAVWRKMVADRFVEVGALDQKSADECAASMEVDFMQKPEEAILPP